MNVVVLSNCGPFDNYVIRQVHGRWPLRRVLRPQWVPRTAESRWSKLRTAPLKSIARFGGRSFDGWRRRRMDRAVSNVLFGKPKPDVVEAPVEAIPTWAINSPETAELLRSLEVDVLLVSGAPLLKPSIFSIPRIATVNVHLGISPQYRGENTVFWPLYYRDYAHLGVTLHRIDQGIDTGAVLAQGFPALAPADNEASIVAKLARLAADLAVDILQAAEKGPLLGATQPPGGRLFLGKDRRIWHDISWWTRRNVLRQQPPSCPARRIVRTNDHEILGMRELES